MIILFCSACTDPPPSTMKKNWLLLKGCAHARTHKPLHSICIQCFTAIYLNVSYCFELQCTIFVSFQRNPQFTSPAYQWIPHFHILLVDMYRLSLFWKPFFGTRVHGDFFGRVPAVGLKLARSCVFPLILLIINYPTPLARPHSNWMLLRLYALAASPLKTPCEAGL